MRLSEHFTLEEMERSETAQRRGIDNHAPTEAISNLQNLCQEVLEPLRRWLGKPIIINSGYRCRVLNKAVGGASNSQHMTGEAVDVAPLPSPPPKGRESATQFDVLEELFQYIEKNLPFDQLILERASKTSNTWWIHISLRRDHRKNRHQTIRGLVKR